MWASMTLKTNLWSSALLVFIHFCWTWSFLLSNKLTLNEAFVCFDLTTNTNTNLILSDSGAPLKLKFCMLKNTTQADFQLKISTPRIVQPLETLRKRLWSYNDGMNGFQKFLCMVDRHEKNWFFMLKTFLAPSKNAWRQKNC